MDRRYQKRMTAYWAREKKKSLRYFDRLNSSTWFDLAHTHPDWKSKGNRFPESRIIVAKLTYEMMVYAENLAESWTNPIQIFAAICDDTGSNAVYLHTENPNGTIFPYPFENSEWNVTPPPELNNFVDLTTHEIGKEIFPDEVVYFIRKKERKINKFISVGWVRLANCCGLCNSGGWASRNPTLGG